MTLDASLAVVLCLCAAVTCFLCGDIESVVAQRSLRPWDAARRGLQKIAAGLLVANGVAAVLALILFLRTVEFL